MALIWLRPSSYLELAWCRSQRPPTGKRTPFLMFSAGFLCGDHSHPFHDLALRCTENDKSEENCISLFHESWKSRQRANERREQGIVVEMAYVSSRVKNLGAFPLTH